MTHYKNTTDYGWTNSSFDFLPENVSINRNKKYKYLTTSCICNKSGLDIFLGKRRLPYNIGRVPTTKLSVARGPKNIIYAFIQLRFTIHHNYYFINTRDGENVDKHIIITFKVIFFQRVETSFGNVFELFVVIIENNIVIVCPWLCSSSW